MNNSLGAFTGDVQPTVSPYANQVVPNVEKLKMSAYGVPEMDTLDYTPPDEVKNARTTTDLYQQYQKNMNWLQEAAVKGKQAGIDVTKPGSDPIAIEFSQEWFKKLNEVSDQKAKLEEDFGAVKQINTQSAGAGVFTQPVQPNTAYSMEDVTKMTFKPDEYTRSMAAIAGTFKNLKLDYSDANVEYYNRELKKAQDQIDELANSANVPDWMRPQLIQQAEAYKSSMLNMLPDWYKRKTVAQRDEGLDQGWVKIAQADERLQIAKNIKGVLGSEEDVDNYLSWFNDLNNDGVSAKALINGVSKSIQTGTDNNGSPVYKSVPIRSSKVLINQQTGHPTLNVEGFVDGKWTVLTGYDLTDPSGGILDLYSDILKSKGSYGTTKQGTKLETKPPATPAENAPKLVKGSLDDL